MPVQASRLHMILVEPVRLKSDSDDSHRDNSKEHVQQMKPRDAKERGAEHDGATGRVVREAPPFMEHVEPLSQVQNGKNEAEKYGCGQPFQARRFFPVFR